MLVGCCVVVARWNFESHFGLLRAIVILSSNLVLISCCVVVAKRNFESHFGLLRAVVILSSNLVLIGCCVVVAKRNFESHFGLLRAVVILSSNLVLVGCCAVVAKRNFEFHFGLLRAIAILSSNLVLVGCCVVVAKWNFESHFGLFRAIVILSSNLVVVPTAAILLLPVQISLNIDYCLYRINGTILYESLSIFVHWRKIMNKVSVNVECEDSVRDLMHLNTAPYTTNVEDTIPEVGVDTEDDSSERVAKKNRRKIKTTPCGNSQQ